jgi:cell division septal protein FtsQ
MDTEMIILLAAIAVGLGLAGYKAYKKLMADGKITLDEVIDLADDLKKIVDKLPSPSAMKKMKKDELIALANDNGLAVDGTKADLISRLEEAKQVIEDGQ